MTPLKKFSIMSEDDYDAKRKEYGDEFVAKMGAEASGELSQRIDIRSRSRSRRRPDRLREVKVKKNAKRLKVLGRFKKSAGYRPKWMWRLEVLPVLPDCVRWCRSIWRFATSDLNDLYRRVINRNSRLRRLLGTQGASRSSRATKKRMLQEAVDLPLDNGCRGKAMMGANKRASSPWPT